MHAIETTNLTKVYNPKRKVAITALDGVSLTVAPGEIFGLLGPNGAGKTTFIKLLLEIVFPTAGSARVLGHAAGSISAKARLGYLPENHRYPAWLTGEQVLGYFGALGGIAPDTLRTQIDRVLALTGMTEWRRVKIRKYSKGMMQRIGLAQSLLGDPALIILDEPTDGVDPIGRRDIRELLVRLRDAGTTVFINSHLLSEVEMVCDRVAILNKGRLVREGRVRDLTSQSDVYTVTLDGVLPESLRMQWEALRAPVAPSADGRTLTITAADKAALNARIDELRAAGITIETIEHKKQSLEDMFIDVIGRENA